MIQNKKQENRLAEDVSPTSYLHVQLLEKISAALNKSDNQKSCEQYKDRLCDISGINVKLLEQLNLNVDGKPLYISDVQYEMLQVVLIHVREIQASCEWYPEKENIQRLTNENIKHLQEAVECIKSERLGEAVIALERSWAYQDLTSDARFGYKALSTSKAFAKGVYSGAKRAINLPQRAVDIYHTLEALGRLFSKIAEIDELVTQGRMEEAEEKYEALKQKFVVMWENMKERVSDASSEDVAFFIGEVIGDFLTTKGLNKGMQHLAKFVKPKVKDGMKACGEKLEKFVERTEEYVEGVKRKVRSNPGKSKQVATAEGLVFEVEEQAEKAVKKGNQVIAKRKGKRTGGSKNKGPRKNKNATVSQKERIVNKITKTEAYAYLKKNGYENYKDGSLRRKPGCEGLGKNAEFLKWDHLHNDLEAYRSRTKHTGSINPATWEFYKRPVFPRKGFNK